MKLDLVIMVQPALSMASMKLLFSHEKFLSNSVFTFLMPKWLENVLPNMPQG